MEEINALNERIKFGMVNIRIWVILFFLVSIGGGILSYYEIKNLNTHYQTEFQEIKNPEAATSR